MLVLALASSLLLFGCRTVETVEVPRLAIVDLKAFRPPMEPENLIDEPLTDADLMHNSLEYEYNRNSWRTYALKSEEYIDTLKGVSLNTSP